jgi:hypothetical protein
VFSDRRLEGTLGSRSHVIGEAEVNQAQSEVNAVKNANYSNVNNDELRRRIIEGAKNIK